MTSTVCKAFSKEIIKWSNNNPRSLPWESYSDPYKVWATEIMLQQTTIFQASAYIHRFFKAFPNLQKLSSASEEEVLKLWEGLGYYSRARNLHFTAQYVNEELNGIFPKTYDELLKLKGVGPYTAAAIASFCYKEAVPVVDGNVIRLVSRFFGIQDAVNETNTRKQINDLAIKVLDKKAPAEHNQAIMNFGAIQCKPKNPECSNCPLSRNCIAYEDGLVSSIPYKSKKIIKRKRYFEYMIIYNKAHVYYQKRNENDIWKHLWQFPMIEVEKFQKQSSLEELIKRNFGITNFQLHPGLSTMKQTLTHQIIESRFHILITDEVPKSSTNIYKRVKWNTLSEYPSPKSIVLFLSNNNLSLVVEKILKHK